MNCNLTVIEDNAADVILLQDALEIAGLVCKLTVFGDGGSAYDYILGFAETAQKPDLMLVDLNLPKKSGFELLDEIRSSPLLSKVRVVVWSSGRSEKDIATLARYGISKFITKPATYSEFTKIGQALREILEQTSETAVRE